MSIRVQSGSNTIVKKVIVGTPIKRVTNGAFTISTLGGVDLSTLENGALLVYSEGSGNFESTKNIDNEDTNFNGGNF